ncbi:hypothetical protein BEN47_15930 [Hymenobacter lapidarius]|uniref:DUF1682 domain-containing protein n=1 Tax=Hymenobacter lapidarius TaxID=1908237 RepID=A0A1G1T1K5_9BACT|nr:hypothetical protein [Hymenobacter lapidarius]OGX84750.1 hypothetical protein BEN47_15930 [Hymenobacter lapidarius]
MDRKFWLLRGLRFLLFAALFITAAVFLTQYLWNWLVPEVFDGSAISLTQTFGLLVMSRILFGGWFRGGHSGDWARRRKAWQQRMADRMETLNPDEREEFRQQMQQRCGMGFMRRPEPEPRPQQPA